MLDVIQLLPDNIANQIAAGEVIQRPASAVKEMLENAIDAGATQIHLIIKDAGKELIQVNDNGKGMSPTDARLCFERHATSKIKSIDDLFAIRTMGFRGEALASIAAVAQVDLKTKTESDEVGTHLQVENSMVKLQEPCQASTGTSLMVKNLFFNVPARRHFLKSASSETRHIVDEFIRVAMAFPHITFQFTNNNTTVFHLDGGKLKQRIVGLLGNQYMSKLVPVEEPTEVVTIKGFIASPDMATKTRGNQYFFVNNRFIKSAYLNHAVSQAYKDLIAKDEFPVFVLFIDIDPSRIDINVHPTKQEIKFEDERIVYSFVSAAVKHALSKYSLAPSLDFSLNPEIESLQSITQPFSTQQQTATKNDYLFQSFTEKGKAHFLENKQDIRNWKDLYKIQHEFEIQSTHSQPINLSSQPHEKDLANQDTNNPLDLQEEFQQQFLQIAQGYIIVTTKNGFLVIDQHLAHQRILYERYEHATTNAISIQQCLIPQTFELSASDAILLQTLLEELLLLGYHIEPFGHTTFIIQGVPADVKAGHEKKSIEKILEALKHEQSDIKLDKREKVIRTMAMQKAMPYGKKLNLNEMQELFTQLFACEQPQLSPIGKKVFTKLNLAGIEKLMQHD
ncbi:MAG: DNA mismatch repair endonuclease MutL [Bacteroidetes bacterium]|nr:DNA mismatch repair endonuclease MutL [Bacteroidota bacterium]MBK7041206.1 DNA mismatch repair endonuclease MutL [Bacteroidota bacterium]